MNVSADTDTDKSRIWIIGAALSAAMPTIITELGGLHLYAWTYTAYFLSRAVSLPVFAKVELVVGKIITAEVFPEARKPAYKLTIDFGDEIGIRKSSAQITDLYTTDELLDKLVVAVINFPAKQIGPIMSECLVTGFHNNDGHVALCVPEKTVPLGTRLL